MTGSINTLPERTVVKTPQAIQFASELGGMYCAFSDVIAAIEIIVGSDKIDANTEFNNLVMMLNGGRLEILIDIPDEGQAAIFAEHDFIKSEYLTWAEEYMLDRKEEGKPLYQRLYVPFIFAMKAIQLVQKQEMHRSRTK